MYFPTTHWSLLARASLGGETEAHAALNELCRRYWMPVHQFVQMRGYGGAEAEDLTQDFFVHVCQHAMLQRADRTRGRFRSFLLGALVRFLGDMRDRQNALKRGGGQPHVSLDEVNESGTAAVEELPAQEVVMFDRAWAQSILSSVLNQIREEFSRSGRAAEFVTLKQFLPGSGNPVSYEMAAHQMGVTVAALTSEIHRLRNTFRERLRAEVANTVSAPHEIDEEMAHLHRVLAHPATDLAEPLKDGGRIPENGLMTM